MRTNIVLPQESIPSELKLLRQWVCYKAMPRSEKISKVPVNPNTGKPIDAQNSMNWLTFEDALQQLQNYNMKVSGVGFVFTANDPYVGIDVDDCIDESGNYNEVAQNVINTFEDDSYIELSPSRRGIHAIVNGNKHTTKSKNSDYGIEIYSQGRYFTVTGNAINQMETIKPTNLLREIEDKYFTAPVKQEIVNHPNLTEEQVLDRMFRSKSGHEIQQLFHGGTSMYGGNKSSADLALCNYFAFYTENDEYLMDKLFRISGLYRPKWDKNHSADGRTYGQMTIDKARAGTNNVYGGNDHSLSKKKHFILDRNSQGQKDHNDTPWYEKTPNGSLRFMPDILADYMVIENNLVYSKAHFFEGENGVYKNVEDEKVIQRQIKNKLLKKHISPKYIKDTFELLKLNALVDIDLYDVEQLRGKINLKNGIYDITTRELQIHPPELKTALQINASYDKSVTCPEFEKFLNNAVTPEDRKVIQELIGYLLTTETKAEKAFILYGPGRTGKSTLLKLIERILGDRYVSNLSMQDLNKRFSLGRMYGKLLNTFADLPSKPLDDTGVFKALVSGDRLQAENKFKDPFEFRNKARLLFSCNELPQNYVDRTDGFFRRLQLIPFLNQIPENQIDPDLYEKLIAERNGIVLWALEGLHRLIDNNYQFSKSESSNKLLHQYRKESNNVIWFVEEYCILDLEAKIKSQELYKIYKNKCLENNKQPISKIKFNQSLEKEYPTIIRYEDISRAVSYKGISIVRN
ncbi:phage/plasmid primase, P4 family [Virgibacillus flavescens]|uniref:phage/plasmid primase, P4 family n=1 Tax=Virgibacillus flavescens TaxID=1611422 RepID=UPI003D34665E